MRSLVAVALAVLLSGCLTQTVSMTSAFNATEAEHINRRGQGEVAGQMFLTQRGGAVVYGAGSTVYLYPETPYTTERMQKIFQGGKVFPSVLGLKVENEDPNFMNYRRTEKADGQGNFVFRDVAPGNYYVTGTVTWCVPSRYGCDPQGGALLERVTITGPQKIKLIMNGA